METVIWLVELGVGLACLAIGSAAVRVVRLRVVGILLIVAGLAAGGHAIVRLVDS